MKLDLSYRGLTALDGIDLSGVTELYCDHNNLTSLPYLSDLPVLEKLYCDNNRLTSLPDLSDLPALEQLYCGYNQLTSLPPLPFSLKELVCVNNQLTTLPQLPASLRVLNCYNTHLTSLPDFSDLPNLEYLYCDGFLFQDLQDLPWGIRNWNITQLYQYNKKCADLGMDTVDKLPNRKTWDEVAQAHLIWKYRLGGEKWSQACNALEK